MNDQVIDAPVVEIQPVVETNEASAPEQKAETPDPVIEAGTEEDKTQVVEKKYSQEEFDAATTKARKKAEAATERRLLRTYADKLESMTQKPVESEVKIKSQDGKPTIAQFGEDVEGYVEAVADWKLKQKEIESERKYQETQQKIVEGKARDIYEEAEKLPNFDREKFDSLPLTDPMAFAILGSPVGPKLMAYLSTNPQECNRMYALSPARQAAEIGKLEVKLTDTKPVSTSKAPAPLKPVGSKGGQTHKPVAEMSLAELRKFEETRGSKFI